MTYIEFYDAVSLENIATCLSYMPDRVILIGDGQQLTQRVELYRQLLADRGYPDVAVITKSVPKTNLKLAVEKMTQLVKTYPDCVFDITGGDEMLVLALGMVCAANPDKNIQVHKFNLREGKMYDCDGDGVTVFHDHPVLTVRENIRIYGGEIVEGPIQSTNTYAWDLSEDFLVDLDALWRICCQEDRFWNIKCNIFDAICQADGGDGLTVTASLQAVEERLPEKIRYDFGDRIIPYLRDHGLLTHFYDDSDTVSLTFKNEQVKRCLIVEGQVLELKMFVLAKSLRNDDDTPVYNDALCGVKIDWDGIRHDEESVDVENEIDVMLMHGVVPIFISCKNGIKVEPEELYKLQTVARRFGGPYSKMVLIAPIVGENEYTINLCNRAKEMGIHVIGGLSLRQEDDDQLRERLRDLWKK